MGLFFTQNSVSILLVEISCLKGQDEKKTFSHFFKEVMGYGVNKSHQSFAFSAAHVLCVSGATIWVTVPAAIFIVFFNRICAGANWNLNKHTCFVSLGLSLRFCPFNQNRERRVKGITEPFEMCYESSECSQKDKQVLWIRLWNVYKTKWIAWDSIWNKDENKDVGVLWIN